MSEPERTTAVSKTWMKTINMSDYRIKGLTMYTEL